MNYYGGWPILDKSWKKPNPNESIEQLLGRMRRELNEHFMVSILVGPDDKNSSVNILLVCVIPSNTRLKSKFTLISFEFQQKKKISELRLFSPPTD